MNLDDRLTGSCSDWWGPGEVSSPSPCPEQAQPWAQTRLLGASPSQNMKLPRMETQPHRGAVLVGKSLLLTSSLSLSCNSHPPCKLYQLLIALTRKGITCVFFISTYYGFEGCSHVLYNLLLYHTPL